MLSQFRVKSRHIQNFGLTFLHLRYFCNHSGFFILRYKKSCVPKVELPKDIPFEESVINQVVGSLVDDPLDIGIKNTLEALTKGLNVGQPFEMWKKDKVKQACSYFEFAIFTGGLMAFNFHKISRDDTAARHEAWRAVRSLENDYTITRANLGLEKDETLFLEALILQLFAQDVFTFPPGFNFFRNGILTYSILCRTPPLDGRSVNSVCLLGRKCRITRLAQHISDHHLPLYFLAMDLGTRARKMIKSISKKEDSLCKLKMRRLEHVRFLTNQALAATFVCHRVDPKVLKAAGFADFEVLGSLMVLRPIYKHRGEDD